MSVLRIIDNYVVYGTIGGILLCLVMLVGQWFGEKWRARRKVAR